MKCLSENKKLAAYLGIIAVVIIWGIYPFTVRLLYKYYSPAVLKAISGLVATLSLLLICRKRLKNLSPEYFKVAVPCGLFYSLGELSQTIGFQYTTPATGSFLENISCITVPILMYIFIRQRPTPMKLASIALCLGSVFLLSMTQNQGTNRPMGIILCALAGVFYGVNIAGTGVYSKKLDARLYVLVQMSVLTVVSTVTAIVLNFIPSSSGAPLEAAKITLSPLVLMLAAVHAIVITVLCWLIRTSAMKHVDPTAVAVIMPFSAVVTGTLSLAIGKDTLSAEFIFGAILGLGAVFLSSLSDSREAKTKPENNT